MQINLHQTHHKLADFSGIFSYIEEKFSEDNESGLHVFPELYLTGYPLKDLCFQRIFIDKYLSFIEELNEWSVKEFKGSKDCVLLLGGLNYHFDEDKLPLHIENCVFKLSPGQKLEHIYTKRLLPNYDIYDEQKYFDEGKKQTVIKYLDRNIGILICEDMWPSSHHELNPCIELHKWTQDNEQTIDLIVNLSASPFIIGKASTRVDRAKEFTDLLHAPFVYVNRVGGEDEILFDGDSFIFDGDNVVARAKMFESDHVSYELDLTKKVKERQNADGRIINTWESLFNPQIDTTTSPAKIPNLTDDDCEEILQALKFGILEYSERCGMDKFLVALSGGIDSSLLLSILRLIIDDPKKIEAIFMPGLFSSSLSYDLSYELCKNLDVKLYSLPIKFFHSSIKNAYKDSFSTELEGLADENIQSRLRGSLLYARSNATGAMVLNTSNKSEIAVGYSTIYGDSVGAISPLGDLYKSEVFQLSKYINKRFKNIIPEKIITRPPSAELREDQEDSQSLPPYERLDCILEGILSCRLSYQDIVDLGFKSDEVESIYKLYERSEYKRSQFCPIIKLKTKSFGIGHSVPIVKNSLI